MIKLYYIALSRNVIYKRSLSYLYLLISNLFIIDIILIKVTIINHAL